MNYQDLLAVHAAVEGPTRAALIGVGQFGRTLLAQSRRIEALELLVLCDLDMTALRLACAAAGLDENEMAECGTEAEAAEAIGAGRIVLTRDPAIAIGAPVDCVVEATGDAEAGARNAETAIAKGRNLTLVTKETDATIGPLLARRAREAGLVLSQVDGDQPSLLLGLISWARLLGLEVVCAGKASEYDFVFDPADGTVRPEGLEAEAAMDPALWLDAIPAVRAKTLAALPQRTPPDFCELCIVANSSGLKPDRPELHAAIARPLELPSLYSPQGDGGVLGGPGRLDMFNCLRRPDEISAAGGVFAVLAVPDAETGALFRAKGIPVSADGRHVLVYNPTHLLGVEAPVSIILPHRLGLATGSRTVSPVCDVTMRAVIDLPEGTLLTGSGTHHRVQGVEPLLSDHAPLAPTSPVPWYLAMNRRLSRPVAKGQIIPCEAVEAPAGSALWRLRVEQDRIFGRSGS